MPTYYVYVSAFLSTLSCVLCAALGNCLNWRAPLQHINISLLLTVSLARTNI